VIKSDGFKNVKVVILRSISIPNFMTVNLKNIKVGRFRNANMVQNINFEKYKHMGQGQFKKYKYNEGYISKILKCKGCWNILRTKRWSKAIKF
jgi:hypothetical protein